MYRQKRQDHPAVVANVEGIDIEAAGRLRLPGVQVAFGDVNGDKRRPRRRARRAVPNPVSIPQARLVPRLPGRQRRGLPTRFGSVPRGLHGVRHAAAVANARRMTTGTRSRSSALRRQGDLSSGSLKTSQRRSYGALEPALASSHALARRHLPSTSARTSGIGCRHHPFQRRAYTSQHRLGFMRSTEADVLGSHGASGYSPRMGTCSPHSTLRIMPGGRHLAFVMRVAADSACRSARRSKRSRRVHVRQLNIAGTVEVFDNE